MSDKPLFQPPFKDPMAEFKKALEGPGEAAAQLSKQMGMQRELLRMADPFADLRRHLHGFTMPPNSRDLLSPAGAFSIGPALNAESRERVSSQLRKHEIELTRLRDELAVKAREALEQADANEDLRLKLGSEIAELTERLDRQERVGYIFDRLHPLGQARLIEDPELEAKFQPTSEHPVFVMSVDIRRSTELMLKARSPQHFAAFITKLCEDLTQVVVDNLGVFDKFTGDGVLAYFPDFYSGKDAGYRAVAAAASSHRVFADCYREFRSSFVAVPTLAGLGIGIDFGKASLVRLAGGLTVVGVPVVYACRLSGAPAGKTLVNQAAFEQIRNYSPEFCSLVEGEFEIKHEGPIVTHEVCLTDRPFEPALPDWLGPMASAPEEPE